MVTQKKTFIMWTRLESFGWLCLVRGLEKKENGAREESSQNRITVAFFVSAAGVTEKPIFIWKSANPRCLKRFDKSVLPVTYFDQRKAWMTGDITEAILSKFNCRLSTFDFATNGQCWLSS